MTTKELLELNYYEGSNKVVFQKCLRKIKPFENETDDVKLELLEKYIGIVCRKYPLLVDYIHPLYIKDEKNNLYSSSVRNLKSITKQTTTEIYASSIYELFVKISILLYSEVKRIKE